MVPYSIKIEYNLLTMNNNIKKDYASESQKRAFKNYEENTVENVRFRVHRGKKKLIEECANKNNESINGMLNRLVDDEIKKVLKK